MMLYLAELAITLLVLFLLGCLIGGLAFRRFGKAGKPDQPEASSPSHSA